MKKITILAIATIFLISCDKNEDNEIFIKEENIPSIPNVEENDCVEKLKAIQIKYEKILQKDMSSEEFANVLVQQTKEIENLKCN